MVGLVWIWDMGWVMAEKSDEFKEVKKLLDFIQQKVADEECVYRGTPKKYRWRKGIKPNKKRINSGIFRKYGKKINFEGRYQPADAENDRIKEVRTYPLTHTSNLEILSDLRHFGGDTTLIDFSRDLLVALFFACNEEFGKDGELIVFPTAEAKNLDLAYFSSNDSDTHQPPKEMTLLTPAQTQSNKARVIAQKSVFIHAPEGFISPDLCNIIPIKSELKELILKFLKRFHDIDERTIYPDLHGFIDAQDRYPSPRMSFYVGNALLKQENYEEAEKEYDKSIRLQPDSANVFCNRGYARSMLQKHDEAVEDYTEAIHLNPNETLAYTNRGFAYFALEEYDKAIDDYTEAIRINPNDANAYGGLGWCWEKLGNSEKAKKIFAKAEELGFEKPNKDTP